MAVTKWQVLQDRKRKAYAEWQKLCSEIAGLEQTPCHAHPCSCGATFKTEADFAKHFVIGDTRYLNLGECPKDPDLETKLNRRYL